MSKYHPNTHQLMRLHEKAVEAGWADKYPRRCFPYEVAEEAGELGNDYPSDRAIEIATEKLDKFYAETREGVER